MDEISLRHLKESMDVTLGNLPSLQKPINILHSRALERKT